MSRRRIYLVVPALLACALGYLQLGSTTATATRPAARASEADVSAPAPDRSKPAAERGTRARYELASEHRAAVNGKEAVAVEVTGTWITMQRRNGDVEVQLSPSRLAVVGQAPPASAEVSAPFGMVKRDDGALAGLSFSAETSGRARDFLAGLATTFQWTERPGDAWTVEEEDLTGRYEARYTRNGDTITRTRGRYTAMRGAKGLEARSGDTLVSSEESVFTFDARGLVSATVRLEQTSALGKGMPTVTMRLRASLVRRNVAEVALGAAPELAPEPITSHVDRAALARNRNEGLVAGARAPELIEAARAAAHLETGATGRDRERSKALRRLSALAQLDGAAAKEVAGAIRQSADDRETVELLAGALSSAPTPEATDALASLLDAPLPDAARSTVLMSLALAEAPTAGSADALTNALDTPFGRQAALALGAEAHTLGDAEAASEAIDELLRRYEAATTYEEKRTYLQALANTGSRDVIPVMLAAISSPDFGLARLGAFGLRLVPGDDVDDTLWNLIRSGSPVMFEALQAVGYRSPELWKPRLLQAKALFAEQKRVLEAIQALLTKWGNLSIPAKP